MAQEGGSARLLAVGILLFSVLHCALVVQAVTSYLVGDSQGWDLQFQSSSWTAGKNFKAGDTLVFNYDAEQHNLVVVSARGYSSCTAGASRPLTSGSDTITLKKGVNYFICSFPGHCSPGMRPTGMKLAVKVT